MTIDEAIKHAEEVAEENERWGKEAEFYAEYVKISNRCVKCAKEHRQLAEWLKELKMLRSERPHGTWVDVPKYNGFYVCSKCLERLDGDFERFDHWEMKKDNFCSQKKLWLFV